MTDRHVLGTPAGRHAALALMGFIDASPSPFHACVSAAGRLDRAGVVAVDEREPWPERPGPYYLRRGGSLVAWATADHHRPGTGFRIVGAHTDSPNLRVKPNPDTGGHGFRQLAVEPYGGVLLNTWLDRDLGLSGRVTVRGGGGAEERLLRVEEPLLRIPQLAIHLDREITSQGLQLNPQQHLTPVWGAGSPRRGAFREWLADRLGTAPDDVLAWDLMLHDLTPSTLLGVDDDLISAPRLDNLCSSWAGTEALAAVVETGGPGPQVPVLVLFDHEEVGSTSERGAGSTLLPTVLERVVLAAGGGREDLLRALAASVCGSADNAHATHPNYPDRHEPGHTIAVNAGPVLKENANLRYATDAASAAELLLACERAGVPHQRYAHRADLPCGSTIGPVTAARLGIPTFDVGMAQLAMHSARELCGAEDPAHYAAAMAAFFAPAA